MDTAMLFNSHAFSDGRICRLCAEPARRLSRLLWSVLMLGFASLCTADTADWPLHGANHQNHRHSPLQQIDRSNLTKLSLAWSYRTGKVGSFQASPIVVGGIMYISTAFNDVVALDAASGKEIWRYRHRLNTGQTCCGPANRGVAVVDGRVFQATIDGRLLALDQRTGAVLWDAAIGDIAINVQETLSGAREVVSENFLDHAKVVGGTGHSFNTAPQVYGGLVFVGSTGTGFGFHVETDGRTRTIGQGDGRTGLRGFVAAFDAATGKEVWRWYSVPDGQWTGEWRETTRDGEALHRDIAWEKAQHRKFPHTWKLGGGSLMGTPAIDPETGLLFLGTGNPAPSMDDSTRPGDNLHTCSVVALDARTGKLVWAYQEVPHDRWGYEAASPPVLFDLTIDGKPVKAVGEAGKTGWFYVLDRQTGRLIYKSEPFVPQHNLFALPTEEGVRIWPSIAGGTNWSPVALDPADKTVFIAALHMPATYYQKKAEGPDKGPWQSYSYFEFDEKGKYGLLTAIGLGDGRVRWQHRTPNPLIGGVLHTAGNLVFSGEGSGEFFALDAESGRKLWSYKTRFGVNAPPISYAVNGRQYVAVAAGGNALKGYPVGDELLVFALIKD
jgi:glucose dehydrogenase